MTAISEVENILYVSSLSIEKLERGIINSLLQVWADIASTSKNDTVMKLG